MCDREAIPRPLREGEQRLLQELRDKLNRFEPIDGELRHRLRAFFQDYPIENLMVKD